MALSTRKRSDKWDGSHCVVGSGKLGAVGTGAGLGLGDGGTGATSARKRCTTLSWEEVVMATFAEALPEVDAEVELAGFELLELAFFFSSSSHSLFSFWQSAFLWPFCLQCEHFSLLLAGFSFFLAFAKNAVASPPLARILRCSSESICDVTFLVMILDGSVLAKTVFSVT